jgi:prophage regulatory protein
MNKPSLIRRAEVQKRTALSTSQLYAKMQAGEFPKPVKIGARARAWLEAEISEWIATHAAQRESGKEGAQ